MFDNLLALVQQHVAPLTNQGAIPSEHQEGIANEATHSIIDTLQQTVANGGITQVLDLFKGENGSNALVQQAQQGFAQNIMSKFGLDASSASNMAAGLIPQVIQSFIHKTNDANDSSFNIQDIISHVSGGNLGGFDVSSLISGLTGGHNEEKSGSTDILGQLGGLFK